MVTFKMLKHFALNDIYLVVLNVYLLYLYLLCIHQIHTYGY